MQQARLLTRDESGLEAWITWDESAQVYELWASSDCDDCIGCADTRAEALKVANHWFDDRNSY